MNHKKVRRYLRLLGLFCIVRTKKPMKYIPGQRKRSHMNMVPNQINNHFLFFFNFCVDKIKSIF